MYDRFKGQEEKIILAVSLEGDEHSLVKAALDFAARTDMTLRLVHICEPWKGRHLAATYPGEYLSSHISQLADEKRLRDAEKRMADFVDSIDTSLPLESGVIFGHAAQGIYAEALTQRASLIMCATQHAQEWVLMKGFSTALDLLSRSTIPVLVMPNGADARFSEDRWTILAADDLSEGSRDALGVASELAYNLGGSRFIHFTAFEQEKKDLKSFAAHVLEMMASDQLEHNAEFSKDTVIQETRNRVSREQKQRLGFVSNLLATHNGDYMQCITFGNALREIKQCVNRENPTLLVFGKHETIHRKPFAIGKVPFYAIFQIRVPVMVVPAIHQLR